MNKKEQIEEMAREIAEYFRQNCRDITFSSIRNINKDGICEANVPTCLSCKTARCLFAAGYRKQVEAEWISEGLCRPRCSLCSVCSCEPTLYCPHCGAKMEGIKFG